MSAPVPAWQAAHEAPRASRREGLAAHPSSCLRTALARPRAGRQGPRSCRPPRGTAPASPAHTPKRHQTKHA
eukprot:2272237-Rhodomonas_salina.1